MRYLGTLLTALVAMLALPLAGILLTGRNLYDYLQFPPLTGPVPHAPFSMPVFLAIAVVEITSIYLGIRWFIKTKGKRKSAVKTTGRFPWWGWTGLLLMACGWYLAWTRQPWFAPFQRHTFCLPWAGYILAVNGWCAKRASVSWFRLCPGRFGGLFFISMIFWWFFEYFNRFVGNWYYLEVDVFSKSQYLLFASLAFATVLPAVASTCLLLLSFPACALPTRNCTPLAPGSPRRAAMAALPLAAMLLFFLGIFPDQLFAFVWIAPLVLLTCIQALFRHATIFAPLAKGDWRPVLIPAMSALICGFFWELWNYKSLARWAYCLPYVDRWPIFAMPVAGYGGYLPFGIECWAIASLFLANHGSLEKLSQTIFQNSGNRHSPL